ncbi:Translation initiation factor 3 subunit b [Coemansia sp. RSA 922]|nr:Translation initiation factor 3 subunit b [Coemansia sp. S3946]KAJ2114267.1 Translation initiation factor 3 subunit b [Coemansia sp. RSA 922]
MVALSIDNLPASEEELDFSDLERRFAIPEQEETLENVIFVDNLPVVEEEKEAKLIAYITKTLVKFGKVKKDGVHMPKDDSTGKVMTKGYMFVEYTTAEQAQAAIRGLNGFKFDKSHILLANRFMDVEKYSEVDDVYRAPPVEAYVEREHLRSWLADDSGRDQFAMYAGQDLTVFWNEPELPAEMAHKRTNWTETHVQWSPLGSYMCTFHRQGLALWGGESWKKLMRFVHLGVRVADFSPSERYLVTWASEPISIEAVNQYLGEGNEHQNPYTVDDEGHTTCVWDAYTGSLLRSFPTIKAEDGKTAKASWSQFKWSPSERYLARMTPESGLSIYDVQTMGLVDKKAMKVPGIQDFAWCPHTIIDPRTNVAKPEMIAYWTPEEGNLPARVSLISVPSKTLVRTKNLFNVFTCALHWHPQGQMLCVRVQRYTKSRKSQYTNLEIFRTNERDVPVDVIELKDSAVIFEWEPVSENYRFAIVHSDDPNPPPMNASRMATATVKTSVSFYAFERQGKLVQKEGFKLLKTLSGKNTTNLKWSPQGRHIVLATLRTISACPLEFCDVDFDQSAATKSGDAGDAITVLETREHYGVTDLDWDPTGRFVVSSASSWRHTMENGYVLWDFKGQQLNKASVDRFKQIVWRPRPRSLLTEEQKREVRKNLKDYSKEFDDQDERKIHAADAELMSFRRRRISEWVAWREQVESKLQADTEEALSNGYKLPAMSDNEDFVVDELVEEVIEEKEEIIN